jgi:hypothetical protein
MKKTCTLLALVLALAVPQAQAGLISSEQAIGDERSRVKALIERPELAQRLQEMGLPPEQAAARVDAMSEAEVASLAGQLQTVPAGGDLSNTDLLLLIILVILIALLI